MYNILFNGSTEAKHIFILAHGAGSPMDSHFMNALALNMSSDNLLVIRFEFSYMQKRRQGIKLFPEKLEKLIEYFISIINFIKDKYKDKYIWIGGKSMGGRVACHVSNIINVRGVIVFGYPFHSLKKPYKVRCEPLSEEGPQILIIQGDRDKMGNRSEVIKYELHKKVQIVFLAGGDHSFLTLKKSRLAQMDLIELASKKANNFINKTNYNF